MLPQGESSPSVGHKGEWLSCLGAVSRSPQGRDVGIVPQ